MSPVLLSLVINDLPEDMGSPVALYEVDLYFWNLVHVYNLPKGVKSH